MRTTAGIALAAAIMVVSFFIADRIGEYVLRFGGGTDALGTSPLSGAVVAIVVGALVGNLWRVPDVFRPGIQFCFQRGLRLGIVLIGIKLSLFEIGRLGGFGLPVVIVTIGAGLGVIFWLTKRLGVSQRFGMLIAAGTTICGITAVLTVAPTIKASDEEVAYAVSTITFFGLAGMLVYPYVVSGLLASSEHIGMFLGLAVHDTAQVIGAALTYRDVYGDDTAFQVATVTKLTRNLFLAFVTPFFAWRFRRALPEARDDRPSLRGIVPLFVWGFLLMSVARTGGDALFREGYVLGTFGAAEWAALVHRLGDVLGSKYVLGTALAAVGLNANVSSFSNVGFKPFVLGLLSALTVGGIGFIALSIQGFM